MGNSTDSACSAPSEPPTTPAKCRGFRVCVPDPLTRRGCRKGLEVAGFTYRIGLRCSNKRGQLSFPPSPGRPWDRWLLLAGVENFYSARGAWRIAEPVGHDHRF